MGNDTVRWWYTDYFQNLERIKFWFLENELFLNIAKSSRVIFCPDAKKIPKNIETKPLGVTRVAEFKSLGVIFEQDLIFSSHIDQRIKAATSKLVIFSKIAHLIPSGLKKIVLQSCVIHPSLYGNTVHYPFLKRYHITELQKIQNWALRLVLCIRKGTPCSPVEAMWMDKNWQTSWDKLCCSCLQRISWYAWSWN